MQVLREEGRAVLTKAGESLRSLGTYAASRAIADTGLVLRVTAVVAAEVVAEIGSRITPLLLPSAKGRRAEAYRQQRRHGRPPV